MDFPPPLAIDAPEVERFRAQHAIPKDSFIIAHAAALTAEKRQRDMLDSVVLANRALSERQLPGVHLAIAGSGELEQDLRDRSRQNGLESCVHFLGFLTDLRPLWALSSMALFASEAEGLCTALIEAQGAGLPAVITRAGGMPEVVEDNATGAIVEIGAVRKISEAILMLRDNPKLRAQMGESARSRAQALFSSSAMVEGILQAYREVSVD
jgi:glycosyltransferase involved in cell wall biosynthesis